MIYNELCKKLKGDELFLKEYFDKVYYKYFGEPKNELDLRKTSTSAVES
jgi:predicted solute-binding protein